MERGLVWGRGSFEEKAREEGVEQGRGGKGTERCMRGGAKGVISLERGTGRSGDISGGITLGPVCKIQVEKKD